MTETAALQKLLTWLSPAFPVGAFAWSAGLESAIASGTVHDRATTQAWIEGVLHHGSLRTDAILFARAHRAANDPAALRDLADLCLALTPARERHEELTQAVLATLGVREIVLLTIPIVVLVLAVGIRLGMYARG